MSYFIFVYAILIMVIINFPYILYNIYGIMSNKKKIRGAYIKIHRKKKTHTYASFIYKII